jgi:type VI secretion system secreted protein VgrG
MIPDAAGGWNRRAILVPYPYCYSIPVIPPDTLSATAGHFAYPGSRRAVGRPPVPAPGDVVMSDTPQENRPLRITFPDVPDAALVITAFGGTEFISRPFTYTLTLAVPVTAPITFAQVLGKPAVITAEQAGDEHARYIHGLISRVTQGKRDDRYITYTADLVPALWLLTRTKRSRIFQTMTTEEIIREVVGGLYDLSADSFKLEGKYHPRNFTTQYRETDFDFLCRVIEEEGIYFFFTHTADGTKLVFSDNPRGHLPVPGPDTVQFWEGRSDSANPQITRWEKVQEIRTNTFQLTDHSFEMPDNRLEVETKLPASITAGTVTHDLTWPESDKPANVDHPGGYERWRDGIAPGGAERPDDLQHVFDDNARLSLIRSQVELLGAVQISGESTFSPLTPGHKFTLADHPDADGEYVVTSVEHAATCGSPSSGEVVFQYANTFTCIPAEVPYRPVRTTPRPYIHGTQTGVVVGSDDAEIEPDKYGRVKVWFRWDPAGPRALDTSCWVRVATPWAGKQWGMIHIPRIGDEVVVAFEDGDPDRPIIIGSVWNADNMPIYTLPDNKTQSGIKTHSSTGGNTQNYNEIKFEDKKGSELVSIHAEKDMSVTIEDNYTVSIGADQKDAKKAGKSSSTTYGDTTYSVTKGDYKHSIDAGKADYFVKGPIVEVYDNTQKTQVTTSIDINTSNSYIHVESPTEIKLTVGGSTLTLTPDTIKLISPNILFEAGTKLVGKAPLVEFEGTSDFKAHAPHVNVDGESDAMLQSSGGKVDVIGTSKVTVDCGGNAVECSPAKVAVAGKLIDIAAQGTTKIAGMTVMLN